jgi:hypothetical protein
VRTTVRLLSREAELRSLLSVDNARLSFHETDLEHDAGWAKAAAMLLISHHHFPAAASVIQGTGSARRARASYWRSVFGIVRV